jgi:outer membrane protein insertion porin family
MRVIEVQIWLRSLAAVAVLAAAATGCARPRVAELYPQLEPHSGRVVTDLAFRNHEPFRRDTLRALTETEVTRWFRERRFNLETVARDVARLTALYRQTGYFGTVVVPEVEELAPAPGPVRVVFRVERGPAITVDTVVIEGTEGIADPDSLARSIPLRPGDLFELPRMLASSDQITEGLRARGHAQAEMLRNYTVDLAAQRATVWLVAVPGPRMTVDSVLIEGLEVLRPRTIRRHLAFQEGDLLVLSRLRDSQRNLFDVDVIQFASVAVAPDTLQADPDDPTTATVLVHVNEADRRVVEALAGFGTQDCVRTGAQWTDRALLRGDRRLTISGSVSRIASNLCEPRGDTLFDAGVDYRFAAEVVQPYFITSRNRLTAQAVAERNTQPGLFRRTAQGGLLSLTHRLGTREVVSGAAELEYRVTDAVPALYCYAFAVCTPEDIEALGEPRWRNSLGASWFRDRSNRPVSPSHGHNIRSSLMWTHPVLGSDYSFVRSSAEGALYRSVLPGWVFATFLRVGTFVTRAGLGLEDFVPPEERFFAGGPNSVRGFGRNQLGPGVWLYEREGVPEVIDGTLPVTFFPTGGVSVAVTSAELRFPSPLFRRQVRLAAFVDAGAIGLEPLWDADLQWRVTPGGGIRVETPIGPARIDLAFDPHDRARGPLVAAGADGVLRRIVDGYRPDPPGFWGRFQLHIAVGQAF